MSYLHVCSACLFGRVAAMLTATLFGLAGSSLAAEVNPNFALPSDQLMEIMRNGELDIIQVKRAGGVMGAKRIKIQQPDGNTLKFKWKTAPKRSIDGWNNSPRLEIAAYEVQKLILDPKDYVVPPTTTRCLTAREYREMMPELEPSLEMANCVYGMLAAWLKDVTVPSTVFDDALFREDPDYALHVANMNLVGYLIRHKDNRRGNLLVSSQEGQNRFFLVDNGLAFNVFPSNFYALTSFHRINVPALPARAIERLRKVDREDLDAFGILVNMEVDERGVLVHAPTDVNLDPKHGLRFAPGQLQLGLTVREIDKLEERIIKLLERVDSGEIATFGDRHVETASDS